MTLKNFDLGKKNPRSAPACPLILFSDLDDGEALKQLLLAEKALFQNMYPQVVLTHAASSMAANYCAIIEIYKGCSVPFLKGRPVSVKTTALKAALSVFRIQRFINGMYILKLNTLIVLLKKLLKCVKNC